MNTVYRIHITMVKDNGQLETYGVQGDNLKKVTKKARKLADILQSTNPTHQANFFLFEAEWKDLIMPEEMQIELMG
jgi:hypothetical protein